MHVVAGTCKALSDDGYKFPYTFLLAVVTAMLSASQDQERDMR